MGRFRCGLVVIFLLDALYSFCRRLRTTAALLGRSAVNPLPKPLLRLLLFLATSFTSTLDVSCRCDRIIR
jgi:hypothetical protein